MLVAPKELHDIITKAIEESPKINQMDGRLTAMGQEFHEFRLLQEDMEQTLKLVLDAVIPAQKRGEQIEQISDAVDNHEIRITVVEDVVKDHLNDKA